MWKGSAISSAPRYGHRSDPQMQVDDSRMIASVGFRILGSSTSSTRTSPGAYITTPRMKTSYKRIGYDQETRFPANVGVPDERCIDKASHARKTARTVVDMDNRAEVLEFLVSRRA